MENPNFEQDKFHEHESGLLVPDSNEADQAERDAQRLVMGTDNHGSLKQETFTEGSSAEEVSSPEIDKDAVEHMLDPANILDLKAAYEHELERQQAERSVPGVDFSATDQEVQNKFANDLKSDMIATYAQTGRDSENPRVVADETINQIAEMMDKSYDELEEELEQKGSVDADQIEVDTEGETGEISGDEASAETDDESGDSQSVYEQEPDEEEPSATSPSDLAATIVAQIARANYPQSSQEGDGSGLEEEDESEELAADGAENADDSQELEPVQLTSVALNIAKEGREQRGEQSEDAVLRDDEQGIYGVFDGMGGHAGGREASQLAQETIYTLASEFNSEGKRLNQEDVLTWISSVMDQVNQKIEQEQVANPELGGMGTTATILQKFEDEDGRSLAAYASVGDSSLIRVRNGQAEFLTEEECLPSSPNVITNVLSGGDSFKGVSSRNLGLVELMGGDRLVLVSDGITGDFEEDKLDDETYSEVLSPEINPDPSVATQRLIEASTKVDDKGVVVVDIASLS